MDLVPLCIIGLGRVGAGNLTLAGDLPMSHLAAATDHGGYDIVRLIDKDRKSRERVQHENENLRNCISSDLVEIGELKGGVVVIATPSDTHATVVEEIIAAGPALVILEKPLADNLEAAQKIVSMLQKAKIQVRVNFHRRFDPRIQKWRAERPMAKAITCHYGKGLGNYASHLIDLLMDWYGDVESVCALGPSKPDVSPESNLSFGIRMAAGFDAVFHGLGGLEYDLCEMDIQGDSSQLVLRAGGAEIVAFTPEPDRHYQGYTHLAEHECDRGPVSGFRELYGAVHRHMNNEEPLGGCNGDAALINMQVLDAALVSAQNGGRTIAIAQHH